MGRRPSSWKFPVRWRNTGPTHAGRHRARISGDEFSSTGRSRVVPQVDAEYPRTTPRSAYLGAALGGLQPDRGGHRRLRAFELRSDLPEARIGGGVRLHVRTGKLTEARGLLDFWRNPGSRLYSLEPLDTLAREVSKAERHEDALALFAVIQKELPGPE